MRSFNTWKSFSVAAIFVLALTGAACQTGPVANNNANTNTNANTANTNASPATTANTNATAGAGGGIETREPEQYQATLVFTAQAENNQQGFTLPIKVVRDGTNRRYSFNVPVGNVGEVVFIDRPDKRYLVIPSRRQFAELTPETTGFDVRSLTPGQMVEQLRRQPGVERVGDDQINGRAVIKYRHAGRAQTGSQAGDVSTESFIYIDKETGLPLRAEMFGASSGEVRGVNQGRVVAEMRDIQTGSVDATMFDVPQGFSRITEEQIRQQLNTVATFAQLIMRGLGAQTGNTSGATTSPSPATTASPHSGTQH